MTADKHQRLRKIDTVTLDVCDQAFATSLQYLKTEVSDQVVFLHTDKH